MELARRLAVLAIGLVVAACASAGSGTSPTTTTVPSSAVASTPSPSLSAPTTAPSSSAAESDLSSTCLPLPHEAPDLEAALPAVIAGRQLTRWSVHGKLMVTCISHGTQKDVDDFAADLATEGLGLDDISQAIGGRSLDSDPPYFIFAFRLAGHPGSEWPPTTSLEYPNSAAFKEVAIEGKQVLVGEMAAMDQSEHVRGKPYVWNSPTVHYLIVTDDEAWAAEALRALH